MFWILLIENCVPTKVHAPVRTKRLGIIRYNMYIKESTIYHVAGAQNNQNDKLNWTRRLMDDWVFMKIMNYKNNKCGEVYNLDLIKNTIIFLYILWGYFLVFSQEKFIENWNYNFYSNFLIRSESMQVFLFNCWILNTGTSFIVKKKKNFILMNGQFSQCPPWTFFIFQFSSSKNKSRKFVTKELFLFILRQ